MRVLVLGSSGMLGHKLVGKLASRHETIATVRRDRSVLPRELQERVTVVEGIEGGAPDALVNPFDRTSPDVVVNCIGIVKQLDAASDPVASIEINSLLPHRLAMLCGARDVRLIHVSTDCVFSGRKGMYVENDLPNPPDLYGRSKLLGEVTSGNCLTLRTSIIGRELGSTNGLVEWFLSNRSGDVDGYTNAVFSGLTTLELADLIIRIIERHSTIRGLYHVSADPISKFELLELLNASFATSVAIHPNSELAIDRSLDSSRLRTEIGWQPPAWSKMIENLASDPMAYNEFRKSRI